MGKIEKTFQSGAVLTAEDMNSIVRAVNDNDENKLGKTEAGQTYATKTELGEINAVLDTINGEVI